MMKGMLRAATISLLLAISFVAAVAALSLDPAQNFAGSYFRVSAAGAGDGDWTYVDHDLNGTRYSPLKQITPQNVNRLAKVCSYTFAEKVPSESAPIVLAGIIYLTSEHYTVALDGSDCRVLWTYQWTPRGHELSHTNRGAAVANGKIIRGTSDGYLIAVDAETGNLSWANQIADPAQGYFISMPPLVHGDLIYIGPAGSEWASSGWVGAFRLSNGEQVWRFNIIPADGEPGADTWGPDPAARKHGGGDLWTPLSYDLEKDLLYVPGGNPAPDIFDEVRPGANFYTNSLIALDAKTGHLVWYNQLIPHDVHDYDLTHVSPVFKANSRTVIATSGKDGVLRVVDRETHKLVYGVPFTTLLNQDAPLTSTPIRVCPGSLGGETWNGGAYSPKLNLLVLPTNDLLCSQMSKNAEAPNPEKSNAEGRYTGGQSVRTATSEARGRVTGFDASTGKERWRYEAPIFMVAGVTITASDLVFTGEAGGFFDALDARSGKMLFRVNLGDSIQGGVITYSAHDLQYVAVVSGAGGVFNPRNIPEIVGGNPTVSVFALPKK